MEPYQATAIFIANVLLSEQLFYKYGYLDKISLYDTAD